MFARHVGDHVFFPICAIVDDEKVTRDETELFQQHVWSIRHIPT